MAYNNGGGKDGPQQRRVSYNMGTFFSSEKNGNEYQMVKVGFYNESLTFNFYKGTAGASNQQVDAFIKFEYEAAVALKGLLEQFIRARVSAFRSGEAYKDHWFNYDLVFTDKETHQPRKIGSFTIKTQISEQNGKNVAVVMFNNGTEEFRIVLGTPFLPTQLTQIEACPPDIDFFDMRLYALAGLIDSMIRHWPLLIQNDKNAQLMMAKFQGIYDKLGISSSTPNDGGGRYSSGSYRQKNNGGGNNGGGSADDGGSYNSDNPF